MRLHRAILVCITTTVVSCGAKHEAARPAPPAPAAEAAPGGDAQAHAEALLAESGGGDTDRAAAPGADLARAIAEVRVANTDTQLGSGGGVGLRADDPASHVAGHGELEIVSQHAIDDTSLGAAAVAQKVRAAYAAELRRCYRAALANAPALAGRLTLTFTVNEQGRTVAGQAVGLNAEVERCVGPRLSSWRFEPPRDADGEPAESSFVLVVQLSPS